MPPEKEEQRQRNADERTNRVRAWATKCRRLLDSHH